MKPQERFDSCPFCGDAVICHNCGNDILDPDITIPVNGWYALNREVEDARARLAAVTRERDEAREYGETMYRMSREITCVWCGHQFQSTLGEQRNALLEHARSCEKSPLRTAEAALATLRAQVGRWAEEMPGLKWEQDYAPFEKLEAEMRAASTSTGGSAT